MNFGLWMRDAVQSVPGFLPALKRLPDLLATSHSFPIRTLSLFVLQLLSCLLNLYVYFHDFVHIYIDLLLFLVPYLMYNMYVYTHIYHITPASTKTIKPLKVLTLGVWEKVDEDPGWMPMLHLG